VNVQLRIDITSNKSVNIAQLFVNSSDLAVMNVSCLMARLHYFVDLRIQAYMEPVPLKYRKLATKYLWKYGYFYSVKRATSTGSRHGR